MLLCLSSWCGGVLQESVEAAGEVAFEAAFGVFGGEALVGSAGDVGLGGVVCAGAGGDDHVQGAVEFAVAGVVDSVAGGVAAGGGYGCGAGEVGEGGFGVDAAFV
jgi:hypothetical protein